MDKETLSNYGWIVICVLVLAVMLALATPFGTFVADAVKSTTQSLFDVNQNALNSTGLINIGDHHLVRAKTVVQVKHPLNQLNTPLGKRKLGTDSQVLEANISGQMGQISTCQVTVHTMH